MNVNTNNIEVNYPKEESKEYYSYQTMKGQSTINYKDNNIGNILVDDLYMRSMTEKDNNNDQINQGSTKLPKKNNTKKHINSLSNLSLNNEDNKNLENNQTNKDKENKMKMRFELEQNIANGQINNNLMRESLKINSNRKEFIAKCSDSLNKNTKFLQKTNNIRKKILVINILSLALFFLNLMLYLNDDVEDYKMFILVSLILVTVSLFLNFLLIISIFLKILSNIYYANIFRFFSIIDFALSLAILIIYIISTVHIIPEIIDDRNVNKKLIISLFILLFTISICVIFITGFISLESILIIIRCKNEYAFEFLDFNKSKNENSRKKYIVLEEETTNENENNLKKFHACLY